MSLVTHGGGREGRGGLFSSTTVQPLLEKYHSITMVLIPWYFGAVYFTMVLMVNIPLQNTMILYLVNHTIFGGAFYSGSVLLPLPWYRN